MLYYWSPFAYSKLSFWANTPRIPNIDACSISEIKDTDIPNQKYAKVAVGVGNNLGDVHVAIALARDSAVEIADYFSGNATVLSPNVFKIGLRHDQKKLEFGVRLYVADSILRNHDLTESDCLVQLYFVEK